MRIVALPPVIRALVFDVDQTLYDNQAYFGSQKTLLLRRLAEELGRPEAEVNRLVSMVREAHAARHGGRAPSFGNTFLEFGVSIEESVRWREELFTPEVYLTPDGELAQAITALGARFELAIVTNNPASVALRTLRALGVERLFPEGLVVGLDTTGVSKPTIIPYRLVSEKVDVPLTEMVSIGDRLEVDIELPVAYDMGGILVERMQDVYELPGVLQASAGDRTPTRKL